LYFFDLINIIYACFQPFLIGKTIDSLQNNNFLWIIVLIVACLINSAIVFFNNIDDDVVYNRIKLDYESSYYANAVKKGIPTSVIDSNVELVDNIVEFIRCFAVKYLEGICMLCATSIFIFKNFEIELQVFVFLLCFILVFVGIVTNKKQVTQLRTLYDINEERRIKIGSRSSDIFLSFLKRRYSLIISNSKKEAIGTLIIDIVSILVLAGSLFLCSRDGNMSVGLIYAGIEYIIMLIEGLNTIPEFYYDCQELLICIDKIDLHKEIDNT